MKVAFLDFHAAPYTCDSPAQGPLGGTQSAVAYLAAALADRGHEIVVCNAVSTPVRTGQVRFVGRDRIAAGFLARFDVLVTVSVPVGRDLRAAGLGAPAVLWCHHDVDQPAVAALADPAERECWDGLAMVSEWQAARYASTFGIERGSLQVLRNAVAPAFERLAERDLWFARGGPPVLYYSSTPFRGLDVLLEAMPLIRSAVPGAGLRVFSGMQIYGVPAAQDEYAWLYEKCRATPGVDYVGPLSHPALAGAIAGADIHAYPCTFAETACIVAMESMAAGSLIVCTRSGALEETTAGFARLVDDPGERRGLAERFAERVVLAINEGSKDPRGHAEALREQRRHAREHYSWTKRALEWEAWLARIASRVRRRGPTAGVESALADKAAGNLLKAAGDLQGAIACYRRALEREPTQVAALYNLGMTLHESGEYPEAEACFRRLLALEPADADALFHLGALLVRRQRLEEGADTYRKALALRPEDAHLWNRLGEALVRRFTDASLAEAETCFRKAIGLQPEQVDGHAALAGVLALQDRRAEAALSLSAACRLEPSSAALQADLLHAKQQLCDWQGLAELAAAVRRAALERRGDPPHPFCLASIESTAAEQLACARHYARSIAEPLEPDVRRLHFQFKHRTDRRLRIGYLSAEFHAHATAWLAAELFELHDRKRFEVIAYSYGPEDGSPMRARLKGAFDRFRELQSVSDAEAASAIHADEVDILVDLKGYTFRARPGIMALRPAPLQVSFLGYPGTMGAPFIDYLIGDHVVTPAAHAGDFTEKLVLMPGSYQVNDRKRAAAATPGRAELGVPARSFVFCCFNQSYKILPEIFSVWMRLLMAVPDSVLWLLDSAAAENLRREAGRRGVDPGRLVFAPPLPLERHLGRLAAADLFLDTFPYNAHTTASDALWMGVPLVTLMGETFPSRVAASLLEAVGLPELVTRSLAGYEALALRLARSPRALAALRDQLLRSRLSAPLFDTPRYVRSLEAAFEKMWEARGLGAAPRLIEL